MMLGMNQGTSRLTFHRGPEPTALHPRGRRYDCSLDLSRHRHWLFGVQLFLRSHSRPTFTDTAPPSLTDHGYRRRFRLRLDGEVQIRLFGAPLGCSGCCWYDPVMASTAESVLQEALKLPGKDRADIAARLIASLDAESTESPADVEEAWAAEIERRCEALDAGTTTTRSWEEVLRRIEADLLRK